MRFILQSYKHTKDSQSIPSIYIELTEQADIPELFREGHVTMPTANSDGEVVQQVCVFLRGRGIVPEKL